jgi:protein tyrosine phosphatase (PTP) superfamily phosphohydrolase (DUF442 family)
MIQDLDWLQWIPVGNGRLALSNRPKLRDIDQLAAQGCQRIVTIQGRNEQPQQIGQAAKAAGLAWTWIPVSQGKYPAQKADQVMRLGLQELVTAIEAGESVLVHCSAGIHRTGMLTFALLRWLGLPEAEALAVLATMRPATRAGIRAEHLVWGNKVATEAGRG